MSDRLSSQNPEVSVIIPTYNHAKWVGQAIESVLNQQFTDYEIIVVDDGSQDNTEEVVKQFGDQVRYLWQENQGLSAARNTGIRNARGEFIGLLDADDAYEPDFLAKLVLILKKNSQADAVYCAAKTVDENNHLLPQSIGKAVPADEFYEALLKGGFFPPVCMFAHKYCYEEVGFFDRQFQGCADWEMWLRFSRKYTIIGTNEKLVRYRVSAQSMSSDVEHMTNDRLAVLQKHFGSDSNNEAQWSANQRKAFGHCYAATALEILQVNDIERGSQYLKKAFLTYPDLSSDFDFFYSLSYGKQTKGFRGEFKTLDLDENAQLATSLLEGIFADQEVSERLKPHKHKVLANTNRALAFQYYGARRFGEAKHYLLRTVYHAPKMIFEREVVSKLVKTFLPIQLVDWFKYRRQFKIV